MIGWDREADISVSYRFVVALPRREGLELTDRSGLRHPEEGLGPGDEVDPVLGLDPVKPGHHQDVHDGQPSPQVRDDPINYLIN